MAAGSRAGARHAREREWMADEVCGGGFGNRTVGIEAGAWLCQVYSIVLRISRDLMVRVVRSFLQGDGLRP
jgi:hypothetical protein